MNNGTFRKSITLPNYFQDYVESCDNFSAAVTQLLDENIERIGDNSIVKTRTEKRKYANEVILKTISSLSKQISKEVNDKQLSNINHLINELERDRKSLELMSTRIKHIENELTNIKITKSNELRKGIYMAVKDSVTQLLTNNR